MLRLNELEKKPQCSYRVICLETTPLLEMAAG